RAVQPEADDVDPADARLGGEVPSLWEVADLASRLPRWATEHRRRPGRQLQNAENDLDQGRLAGAVRPEDGDELPALDAERHVAPDRPTTEARRGGLEPDGVRHRPVALCSAAASA